MIVARHLTRIPLGPPPGAARRTIDAGRSARLLGAVLAVALVIGPAHAAAGAQQDTRQDTTTHTLTMGDAARLAARQSAVALEARAEAQQTSARSRQGASQFFPRVSGAALETERTVNSASLLRFPSSPGPAGAAFNALLPPGGIVLPPIKSVDFRGYVSDTLFSFGAIRRYQAAKATERSAYTEAENAAQQAAGTAAATYLSTQRAEAVLTARLADSALAADLLDIARRQLSAGVGIALDVTRAQAQVAATHAQLIAARGDRDRALLNLYRALGLALDARIVLTDSLSHLATTDTLPPEAQEIERALRHRPDLRAADEQLAAAEQEIGAVRAERLPALALFGDEGVNGGNWNRLLNTYDWGIGVSLPIFDGFRREARIQEQQASVREIVVRRRDLRQQAAIEVRGAYLDLASARQELDAANQQLQLTEQELAEARERFRAGVAGNADVITASLDLNNSRTLEIDALVAYESARVALARATGTVTQLP
jgi:outer membrane protein